MTRHSIASAILTLVFLATPSFGQDAKSAQETLPEVRQLVTFQFQPGKTGEALNIFKEKALPLYEGNEAMLSFRGFLVSDGWHYLRFLGFDSLGDYHDYWTRLRAEPRLAAIEQITVKRKEIIVAPLRALSVR